MNKIEWKKSTIDYDKLNQLDTKKLAQIEGGLSNKGIKHTEESKQKFAKAKIGKKRDKVSVEKSNKGIAEVKFKQLIDKHPKDSIVSAMEKHGNHQRKVCEEIGYTFYTHKKVCKYYGLDINKKSVIEKAEFAITKQSEPILVWMCSKREPYKPIGKPKEYYSVSECVRQLGLHKANMIRNMNNGTPYRGMFFKKK
jgi:bacteriocin-like protein